MVTTYEYDKAVVQLKQQLEEGQLEDAFWTARELSTLAILMNRCFTGWDSQRKQSTVQAFEKVCRAYQGQPEAKTIEQAIEKLPEGISFSQSDFH